MTPGMLTKLSAPRPAYLALIVGLFSIGFAAILVSLAEAPGPVSAFYRMGVAATLFVIPFLRQTSSRSKPYPRPGVRLALFGGVLFALDLTFWATGITISGAATPTLMANTAPIWVGLGSMFIFHERLNSLFWFGLILAMFGSLLVLGAEFTRGTALGLGTFLGLLAAIFYGAYYLVTQRGRDYLNTLTYFWIATFTAAIALLIINFILGNPITGYSWQTYLAFLGLGVIAQVLGWLSINYAQGFLPASIIAPTLLGQPVVTAIFAFLLLDESFSAWHILGGILVLAGIYTIHRSRWRDSGEQSEVTLATSVEESRQA